MDPLGSGGPFNYLNYAALQARLSNPDAKIYITGDVETRQSIVVSGIELVSLEDYLTSSEPLRSIYEHYRVNGHEYTLFCMSRWFYLRALMERQGWGRALGKRSIAAAAIPMAGAPEDAALERLRERIAALKDQLSSSRREGRAAVREMETMKGSRWLKAEAILK